MNTASAPTTVTQLEDWAPYLTCPLDHAPLQREGETWACTRCDFVAPRVQVDGRWVSDLRALDRPQTLTLDMRVPVTPLDRYELARTLFGPPQTEVAAQSLPRVDITTKLDKGAQTCLAALYAEHGPDLRILDLGCGRGDNRRFLHALGFRHVLAVDWWAAGADLLVDAHRLPFAPGTFDVVVSTAVFEHLYNPFMAMANIGRVSTDRAWFVGGASFWEAWHGSSYFHLTPDGWNVLLRQHGYSVEQLWVGWGILPAALSHVLTPGHLRGVGYRLQSLVEGVYRLWGGDQAVRKFQLRASGSYMVYAARERRDPV